MNIADTSLGKGQNSAEHHITTTSLIYVRYCIVPIPMVEDVINILAEMDFLVEIKGGVCLEYVPFPSRLQQKTRHVCLAMTLIVLSNMDIMDITDIMDFIDIMDTKPCGVKIDMIVLKIPQIFVNLGILEVDVVIRVHLTTEAY